MDSTLSSVVAPTSSIIASSSQSSGPARQDLAGQQNPANQPSAAAVSQAAVVKLSASSENRAPTTGSSKLVDAGFEKQKTETDANGKGSKDQENPQTSVSVVA